MSAWSECLHEMNIQKFIVKLLDWEAIVTSKISILNIFLAKLSPISIFSRQGYSYLWTLWSFISQLCMRVVTAARLRWHLSNIIWLFNWQTVFRQFSENNVPNKLVLNPHYWSMMNYSFHSGMVEVGGFESLYYAYYRAIDTSSLEIVTTNLTALPNDCGLPEPDSWEMLRHTGDREMPWAGFVFGQTTASLWYWCADQVK